MLRSVVKWIDQKAAATSKWWDLKLERIKREKEQTENVVKTNSVLSVQSTAQRNLTWIWKVCVISVIL